jgi:hypothetical protein
MSNAFNNVAKLRQIISVTDYGAVGDGVTDDTAAIQAAIDAGGGGRIFFPTPAAYYRITAPLYVRVDRTVIEGEGPATFVWQATANVDAVVFEPTTAGTTSTLLNAPQIRNIAVANIAGGTPTGGTCIKFRQCNGYRLFNVNTTSNGCLEGISIYGGQFGSLKLFTCSASFGSYAGDGTALLTFRRAEYASSRQNCYTVQVEDSRITASMLRGSSVRVYDCDGLHFLNSYWALGKNAILHVQPESNGDYCAALSLVSVYMDCVNPSTGTINGVIVPDSGLATDSIIDLTIGSGCTIGNGSGAGVLVAHPRMYLFDVSGARILNMLGYGVNYTGSATGTLRVCASLLQNNGGGGIYANGGTTLCIANNSFNANATSSIKLAGAFTAGVISGNIGQNNVADLVNTASFSTNSPLRLAGNISPYTGADTWRRIGATASLNFGSLAVGARETLTISVPGAVVGDLVIGNVSSGTNVNVPGGGAQIAFFYGVTAADTVSVAAVNIGTATGDPGALTFTVAIVR